MKHSKKLLLATVVLASSVNAVELDLTDEPLFLNQSVQPALVMTLDDSGSMGLGFMPATIAPWTVIRHNDVSMASSDFNTIYYDPNTTYRVPVRADGTLLFTTPFTNARYNGYYLYNQDPNSIPVDNAEASLEKRWDLSADYIMTWRAFDNYAAGTITGIQVSRAGFNTAGTTRATDVGPAFYYTWNGPANADFNTMFVAPEGTGPNTYTLNNITPAEQQNFTNWFSFYKTRGMLAKAAMTYAFVDFGPNDFKIAWQQINNLRFSMNATTMPNLRLLEGTHRENFFDWLLNSEGQGGTPLRNSTRRAGFQFTKGSSGNTDSPYYNVNYGSELSCQQNFHIALSDGGWNGAAGVTTNDDGGGHTFPDGTVYNPASGLDAMYGDTQVATLADNAFNFWRRDLRDNLIDNVPRYISDYTDANGSVVTIASGTDWWDNEDLYWNPLNDPANWQRVVQFNIGIGLQGALDQTTDLPGIRDGNIPWTDVGGNADAPGRVDDVWHASLNSRGTYFSAKNPTELSDSLNSVITNIISRQGRASAGSVSSSIVSDVTKSFRTGFDTSDWSGFVISSELNADGSFGANIWDASCKLTGGLCATTGTTETAQNPATREIFSYYNGVEFDFEPASIPAGAEAAILDTDYIDDLAALSPPVTIPISDVVEYIRGERNNEADQGGLLRTRQSVLGDIINSSARIVRGPAQAYNDDYWVEGTTEYDLTHDTDGNLTALSYASWREANRNRDNIILVGANDGMLHAFGAGIIDVPSGGDEHWAYIPSKALENIGELIDPQYDHRSYVDATPAVKDAFLCTGGICNWSTVAVGHMRNGGKLFYALDLGNDTTAKPTALWEFTDDDDPDMGYTYSSALISRVIDPVTKQSEWVAFLPNGYNSDNHQSVLYAVSLRTGQLLHKWTTNIGNIDEPNGMGAAVAADYIAYSANGVDQFFGADQAADFVYAGDLHGNVYKFDTQAIFSGSLESTPEILFDGNRDQPITASPRVFTADSGSSSDVMVVFGTGKYIEVPDRETATLPTQYMVGLRDDAAGTYSYPNGLNESSLIEQTISEVAGLRTVSSNPVADDEGWKLALPTQGERMVNHISRDNQAKLLIFLTIIPNGVDPCLPGGASWVMAIGSGTGGSPGVSLFEGGAADGVFINGLALGANQLTTPNGNSGTITIDTSGAGTGSTVTISNLSTKKWGRRSWHRVLLN
ncbi:MAG: hypothetical protein L3J53_04575 [Proteobacteria bacterium]|nr:hypothetical protein [Pseudomonadota bacterium]